MKLGIMGGSFDPIHAGHLRAAESGRAVLGLDEVAFVPARLPPHRPEPEAGVLDRYAMVCLATAHHPAFVPSDLEVRREGPCYTADTLAGLRAERPADELFLIVGSDTFPEMAAWHEAERVFGSCTVVVVARPGAPRPADERKGVVFVEEPGLAVSATEVRSRIREGRSIRYLVPEMVAEYIRKRGLYRGQGSREERPAGRKGRE